MNQCAEWKKVMVKAISLVLLFYFSVINIARCDTNTKIASSDFSKLILGKWQGRRTYVFYPDGIWRYAPEEGYKWGYWHIQGNRLEFNGVRTIVLLDNTDLVFVDKDTPELVTHLKRVPMDTPTVIGTVKGDPTSKTWTSADRFLKATSSRIAGIEDGCSDIVIITKDNKEIARYSLEGSQPENARYIFKADWSPDSRFFVFLTISSTGHQSWHSTVYFFDSKRNNFVEFDKAVTNVAGKFDIFVNDKDLGVCVEDNEVVFEAPDILVANIRDNPANPAKVSLSKLVSMTKR